MLKDRELVTAENRNGVGGARFVLLAGFHDRCVGEPEWMLGVVTWKAMQPLGESYSLFRRPFVGSTTQAPEAERRAARQQSANAMCRARECGPHMTFGNRDVVSEHYVRQGWSRIGQCELA